VNPYKAFAERPLLLGGVPVRVGRTTAVLKCYAFFISGSYQTWFEILPIAAAEQKIGPI